MMRTPEGSALMVDRARGGGCGERLKRGGDRRRGQEQEESGEEGVGRG